MATNFYLNHYDSKPEQNLIEDLTVEAIKFWGMDVFYLPRTSLERDNILGEDIKTVFKNSHMIEVYFENVDGFEGQGNFLSTFGMQIKDNATLIISKRRFQQVVYGKVRPMEGDLIYLPLSNSIFEINFVDHENPFYQVGKLFTYKLTCELYTHSHEDFETGNVNIDGIMTDFDDGKMINSADNKDIQIESDDILLDISNPKEEFENIDDVDPFNGL